MKVFILIVILGVNYLISARVLSMMKNKIRKMFVFGFQMLLFFLFYDVLVSLIVDDYRLLSSVLTKLLFLTIVGGFGLMNRKNFISDDYKEI